MLELKKGAHFDHWSEKDILVEIDVMMYYFVAS